jgi:gliding motility-associated-like protein
MMKRLCFVVFGTLAINAAIAQCNASFTISPTPVCQGQTVTFTDLSSGGVGPFTYNWNFGAGAVPATSTLANPPAVTYSTSGVKTITLSYTATGSACTNVATQTLTVNALPVATFVSNAPQCVGSSVNFTNTGTPSGTGITYSWDFGPGATPQTATMENPSGIVYSTSGTKLITFTVSNGFCTVTDTASITISATPVSSFSSSAPACTNSPVNFTCTGSTVGVTWAWNFGVGAIPAISAAQNPAGVTYTSSGIKTVTLVITNKVTGCVAVSSQTINITQLPTASFTSNAPQCQGNMVNFTNTGTTGAGITYSWDFGPGATPQTATMENPSGIVYSTSGSKLITFTVTNGSCVTTDTASITIKAAPTASFVSSAPQCMGSGVNFTNTGTAVGVTWFWNFGPNGVPSTSVVQSPSGVVFTASGPQTVTLTTTNTITGCASTSTQVININAAPTATFVSNAPQCAGSSVNFTNTGASGAGVTYNWDFGSGANPQTATDENPSGVTYSTSGAKLVTFTVMQGSCVTVDTMTIMIGSAPVASFTSNAPKCTGDSVTFANTGTAAGVTYSWNFGPNGMPNTSTVQNPTVAFSTGGSQTIVLTVTDTVSGCFTTTTQNIIINQAPVTSFSTTAPQCAWSAINFTNTGTTGAGVTYSWNFGVNANPQTSNVENPMNIVYSTGGNKLVTFAINNGSCTTVDTMTIVIDSLPVVKAGDDTTICSGGSVQLGSAPIAGYTYSWSPAALVNSPTISNPIATPTASVTDFVVTVTNINGCVGHDTVVITVLPPLVANAGAPQTMCRNDSVQLGSTSMSGVKYAWAPKAGLNDSTLSSPMASPDSTVTYTLTVSEAGCSSATGTVKVTVHQLPNVGATMNDTTTLGTPIQLTATGGVEFMWSPANGLSNAGIATPWANPDSTTKYVVTVTDINGCVNTDTITVTVIAANLWAPTAFTPNGDGKDDIFYIRGPQISNFDFGVYDRWGEQLFHSENMTQGWDGRKQITGEKMPDGAYIYYVRGTLANGQAVNMQGMVNLVR